MISRIALPLSILLLFSEALFASGEKKYTLSNAALRITFGAETSGFDCLSIENRLAGNVTFVEPSEDALSWPGLWQIALSSASDGSNSRQQLYLNNKDSGGKKTARINRMAEGDTLILQWKGISLGDEKDSLDVTAIISLPSGTAPSEWRINVDNKSKKWGTESITFPILRTVTKKGSADVLLPTGALGGTLVRKNDSAYEGYYPFWSCSVQFLAFNKGMAGLYFGVHDGDANVKTIKLTNDQHAMVDVFAENAGIAKVAKIPSFPVVIAAYSGDWWTAAKIYRNWALQQKWARKGWLAVRNDIPKSFLDIGFWLQISTANVEYFRSEIRKAADYFAPLKIAVHWYDWHQIPFDSQYPEFFPARDGVATAVKDLQQRDIQIMPYINAHLWDTGLSSFTEGQKAAVKDRDGKLLDGPAAIPGRFLTAMCPSTELWQNKVTELCGRLVNELGVSGIYLDQLGGTRAKLCYDASHGHPIGGGSYWTDGYRTMVESIRKISVPHNVFLTSEMFAEQYLDLINGFLIAHLYRHPNDVPLIQAVYSGYTTCFGCLESERDDSATFAMLQGSSFIWGIQPGWLKPWVVDHPQEAALAKELGLYRMAAKEFLIFGELLNQVRFEIKYDDILGSVFLPVVKISSYPLQLPSVMGSVWRTYDGNSLAVVVMNLDSEPRKAKFSVDIAQWLKSATDQQIGIFRVLPDETIFKGIAEKDHQRIEYDSILDAHEVLVLAARPIDSQKAMKDDVTGDLTKRAAILKQSYSFDREMMECKCSVHLENDQLTIKEGSNAELSLEIKNEGEESQKLQIEWPDQEKEEITLAPRKLNTITHEFRPLNSENQTTLCNIVVKYRDYVKSIPFIIDRIAPIEISFGSNADASEMSTSHAVLDPTDATASNDLRAAFSKHPPGLHPGGNVNAVKCNGAVQFKIIVHNNSDLIQSGQVSMKLPEHWNQISGGKIDRLLPGTQAETVIVCQAPSYPKDQLEIVRATINGAVASERITVLGTE